MYELINTNLVDLDNVISFSDLEFIKKTIIPDIGLQDLMFFLEILFYQNKAYQGLNFHESRKDKYFFSFEVECPSCMAIKIVELNYFDLWFFFQDLLDITCEQCKYKRTIIDKYYGYDSQQLENTYLYIEKYLNSTLSWLKEYPIDFKLEELLAVHVDWNAISSHIISMNYNDFLKTPYWKAISHKKMKDANFICQKCNNKGLLNTHHRIYEIHGSELFHLDELIVLCQDCHGKHHLK